MAAFSRAATRGIRSLPMAVDAAPTYSAPSERARAGGVNHLGAGGLQFLRELGGLLSQNDGMELGAALVGKLLTRAQCVQRRPPQISIGLLLCNDQDDGHQRTPTEPLPRSLACPPRSQRRER